LYVPDPDPDDALWHGPTTDRGVLSRDLGLAVRPLDLFRPPESVSTLPPQDADTAAWLGMLLGREIEAGAGDELSGPDAELADAMIDLRLVHDSAALVQLRQACRVTESAHRSGMRCTRPGVREASIAAEMGRVIAGHGMTHAYAPIVTVRGEVLHNPHHDGVVGEGDLVLADVGAETPEGWASDVTRTWPANGRFSPTQRQVYDVVLAAQRAALEAIRPGVRFLDVHRAAGLCLAEGLAGLGILRGTPGDLHARGAAALFFPHGVGHLLGLEVHELEDLVDRAGYA
jgi:Xaa-Pro aminopeptidase